MCEPLNQKRVRILGWYHGTIERETAELTVATALTAAKEGRCPQAKEAIDLYLTKFFAQEKESRRVYAELEKQYRGQRYSIIGLEMTPEQYAEAFVVPQSNEDLSLKLVPIFAKFCPKHADRFQDLAKVYPGPEFEFARRKHGKVRLMPMGDHKLVTESFNAMSPETKNFARHLDTLSVEQSRAYDRYLEMSKDGRVLTKFEIEELLTEIKEADKAKMRKYFSEVALVFGLVEARNKKILEKAIATEKDMVLVVGHSHVPGLIRELKDACVPP